jgi:hypothetical protein
MERQSAVIELVFVLIGGMFLFMVLVAGVLAAFDWLAQAIPNAVNQYERVSGGTDD